MEDKRKALYDALSGEYDLGTYEDFSAKLNDESKRKALYDAAGQDYDLGTYEEYSSKLGFNTNANAEDSFPIFDDEPQGVPMPENAEENSRKLRGLWANFKESSKGLWAGIKGYAGEQLNMFTGSSREEQAALNDIERLEEQGVDVIQYLADKEDAEFQESYGMSKDEFMALDKKERKKLVRQASKIMLDQQTMMSDAELKEQRRQQTNQQAVEDAFYKALEMAGGDLTKAKAILREQAADKTKGDILIEEATETMNNLRQSEGFAGWVGNLLPQMVPAAASIAINYLTKGKASGLSKALGYGTMGGLTLSTAGMSMLEARNAGATNLEVWTTGIADGAIEIISEKIPFDRVTKRVFSSAKANVAEKLGDAVLTPKGRKELEKLLSDANEKLGGKLFSKKNVGEWLTDTAYEAAGEFTAEALQTITTMIYENPEDYPTISEVLANGWEGAKAGLFMGSVTGGASLAASHAMNKDRRQTQGYVDVAQMENENGEVEVVEVVGEDPQTGNVTILHGDTVEEVSQDKLGDRFRFSYEEFENGRLRSREDDAIDNGVVNPGQIRGMEETIQKDLNELQNYFTAEEISQIASGTIPANASAEGVAAARRYMDDVQRIDDLHAAKAEQDQKRKDACRDRIESEVGQRFWVQEQGEDDGSGVVPVTETVEEVVYADGRVGYVVGSDEAGNLTMVYNDGSRGFSTRAEIAEKEKSGEILSNTVMGLNDYLAVKVDIEDVTAEAARMEEEQTANVQSVQAAHPVGSTINVGTTEAKVEVPIIAVNADGVIVQMPDGTTPQLTWADVAHAEGQEVKPKTNAELDQEIVDEYKVAYQPAVKTSQEPSITEREVEVEQTTPANPLPLKADGSVDQTALWNNDPERWAQWNDEQRQDGGANSLAYVSGAIAKEQAKIAELQAAYAAESDFDARDAIEKEIADTQARVERLTAIQQGYVAQAEAAAAPVVEAEPVAPRISSQVGEQVDEQYDGILRQTRIKEERVRILQEYLDKISEGSLQAFVLTSDNYADVMRREGCSEGVIAVVGMHLEAGENIGGFTSGGKLFLMEDGLPSIEEARITYIHERQHVFNTKNPAFVKAVASIADKQMLLSWLSTFVGPRGLNPYKSLSAEQLADEVVARCMEIAYTTKEFSVDLQSRGIPSEIISIITDIDNEQRKDQNLLNSRRGTRRDTYADVSGTGSLREDGRNIEQVSGGVLEQETTRPSIISEERVGSRSTGEGAEVISEEQLNAPNSGTAQQITATDGEVLADTDGKGGVRFSIRTWNEGGRDYLAAWLANDTTLTEEEKADILARMDEFYKNALLYSDTYAPFGTWSDAGVRYDNNGNPLMSVIKANGDYAMNLDFSLVCKKRRPLNRLLRTLVNRNAFATYTLRERELAEINWILQEHGFEVACALCFVDSKRYRVTGVADVFAALYNRLVKSLAPEGVQIAHFNYNNNPNVEAVENGLDTMSDDQLNWDRFDRLLSAYKEGSVEHKVAQYLREHPEARKLVDATDFIEAEGFESVKENNPDLLKFYNMKKGTGGPKASFGDVQYLNDILKKEKSFDAEKAYAVGGVRLQSFSDFVPHMYFDYMQLFAELAAKKLPLHAYTKEVLFAKIFGLTGAKINMSLVPAVVEGGIAPGLDAEGNYAWADPVTDAEGNVIQQGQSFPYDEAMAIQQAEGYSKNCGVIAVGISDAHIEKMLDDPNIPFIIPYHKSSLNAIVARMTNIDQYKDYTNVQNTRKASGSKLDKGTKDFNFNEYLHSLGESGTPQQAAQAYLDWCRENNYKPKFSQFAYHPNYYKLLQDFNTIDLATGEYAPQGAVTMTFPTEESAFGNVETLIQQGLQEDAELEEKMEQEIDGIADQVLSRLEEISKEPKMSEKQQARKMAELADERMAKIKERASGPVDIISEAEKAVDNELRMRVIGEVGARRMDDAVEATTMMDNLAVAKEMEEAGKDAKAIKRATGWERGADKLWRYEMEDFEFIGKPGRKKTFKLSDLIADLALFTAYPELKDIKVKYTKLAKGKGGEVATEKGETVIRINEDQYRAQNPVVLKAAEEFAKNHPEIAELVSRGRTYAMTAEQREIYLNELKKPFIENEPYINEFGGKGTLVHEIQHVIQDIENFAQGGNSAMVDTSDPAVRNEVETLQRVLGIEIENANELVPVLKDIFTRGRMAELSGDRQTALALKAEWNKKKAEWDNHSANINAIKKDLRKFRTLGLEGYRKLAGEVESRNAEARMNMSYNERRNSLLSETEDVAREDQIFLRDNVMMKGDEYMASQALVPGHKKGKPMLSDAEMMADVSFRITKNTKATIESWCRKADVDEQASETLIGYIDETFQDATEQLCAAKWYLNGSVNLPDEDVYKVKDAVKVAKKNKVDALSYDSPMAILNTFGAPTEKLKPIDPDTVPTLTNKTAVPGTDITIYDVEESEQSRENMREIINTHYGKNASPWCLLQGNEFGQLTPESKERWEYYNAYPKQVAFKGGRLLAFSANSEKNVTWWDRLDKPFEGIPVMVKLNDAQNRRATSVINPKTGERIRIADVHQRIEKDGYTIIKNWDGIDGPMLNAQKRKNEALIAQFNRYTKEDFATNLQYWFAGRPNGIDQVYTQEKTISFSPNGELETYYVEGYRLSYNRSGIATWLITTRTPVIQEYGFNRKGKLVSFFSGTELITNRKRLAEVEVPDEYKALVGRNPKSFMAEAEQLIIEAGLAEAYEESSVRFRFTPRTDEQREQLFAKAKAHYGLTNNFNASGYMLPDGSLLDFSEANDGGDPNRRSLDHRDIEGLIMDEGKEYDSRYHYVVDFVDEGAIRMLPEAAGFQLSVPPTAEQRSRLMDYIYKHNGEVIMEITDENGGPRVYMEYNKRTSPSRIFRDMDGYFNEGVVPGIPPIRFRMSNENQAIFVSNAAKAVEAIKQEKATPEQWLKMIEKNGGLKAGEDKWMGLSDWLKASDKKTLTKQEVLDFINENMIVIEETHYLQYAEEAAADSHREIVDKLQEKFNAYVAEYHEQNPDADEYADPAGEYAIEKLRDEMEDTFPYTIEKVYGNEVYVTFDYEDMEEMEKWSEKLGVVYDPQYQINSTRLNYTTSGLDEKHEIALTVPTIESWNETDEVHFGEAGEGRAVAWIRFGETVKFQERYPKAEWDAVKKFEEENGVPSLWNDDLKSEYSRLLRAFYKAQNRKKVLVIDEIQSKRHQEGREKGYKPKDYWPLRTKYLTTKTVYDSFYGDMEGKYGEAFSEASTEEDFRKVMSESDFSQMLRIKEDFERASNAYIPYRNSVPDAPFDKNWHELAMKRMLRYAAENGYDVIAWTKGDQQAERYNLGKIYNEIEREDNPNIEGRTFSFSGGNYDKVTVNEDGVVVDSTIEEAKGKSLSDLVGKDLAVKMMSLENYDTIDGEDLRIGGEGMKGFYDKMLPAFMNKYGKKWGVKVEDIELPNLENGLTMHSVPVTEEMKASVMEGQVMFRMRGENESAMDFHQSVVDEYKAKYTELGFLMALPVDETTAKRFGYTLEELQEIDGLYEPDTDIIAIFAHERNVDSMEVENTIFHEDIHFIASFYPHMDELGKWLWENTDAIPALKKLRDHIEKKYTEDKRHQEMLCNVVSYMMSAGRTSDFDKLIPYEYQDIVRQIENEIGYDRATEESSRIAEPALRITEREEASSVSVGSNRQGRKSNASESRTLTAEERRIINEYFPGAFRVVDSNGNTLTPAQEKFFVNSKAVDKDGNLLVLYHGTPRAGFTEFKSGWFTTSKEDAISYSGDRKGRLFDPNEKYEPETLTAGDFRLGYMTFDSEEDRAAFLERFPYADEVMSEREYEDARMEAEDEEYDALTERRKEFAEVWNAYREYERERFVDTTIGDLIANPEAYTEEDLMRAMLEYDSNASLDSLDDMDAAERKDALVSALQNANEETDGGIFDMVVPTRVPRNGEGLKHNDLGNRTYEVYANVENPYEIDANGRGSEFESGDIYKAVEEALADEQYDGVIVRNWRVGRTQQLGDVVVPKNGSQIKLTSNENPSSSSDIRFRTSLELDEEFGDAWRNQQNEDGRHSTQVANTKSTYEKIGRYLEDAGMKGASILDASSGLGLGTQALREMGFQVDDVEPFPSENREAPTFSSYADIDGKYDVVISNAVLNVIPDDWRADVLHQMADAVKEGGKMIINTRPASNIAQQGVEGKTRITLDSPSEILVKRGDRIAAYQKGFTSEELAEWIKSELGEGWRVEKATKKNSGISGEGTAVVIKESDDTRFRTTGTPTDELVTNGLQLTPAQTAEVAANIFAALPEESRKKITDGLNGNILGLKDAILQIPTSLASKENWNEEDKQMAAVVAEEMTKMAGEMTRPFSAEEGLWLLYNNLNKGTDLISQASRALVQRNLGFDAETLAKQEQAKEDVRFRTVGDATSNAQASLYNRGAVNVWTRLKESFVDMQASVEELVKAIEERTGKVAQGFENILLALNQQSSKGLAAMESYTQKFLNPMFDEIRRIMDETKMKYEDVVRYVILKHGLERNKKLAQRDARSHYQEIYDDIISKITGMTAAQKRTYLTNAQLKEADAKAELATLQAVDMSAMTDEEKREHKKKLAAARKAVEEAEEHLKRAQKIASLSEQEAQDELDKIFEKIENGTDSVFKEMRENDYSGISSMFYDQLGVDRKNFSTEEQYQAALMEAKKDRYSSLKDIETAAEAEVKSFEGKTDTKELWKRINAATKETLRQQYEANMISKDQYDSLRNMFEYYVPLRGFKDNTAEDMYTYYRKPNSTGYTKPILGAEGRKTEAESPFGWIAAMAGSAIASNVKNEAKLALYYFVSNRPENGIATISKTWFVDSGEVDERGKKIFKPAYPPFSEDLSSDATKDAYEAWQENMRELQKKGQAYEAGQRLNLGNAVVNISDANKPEHIVNVKVGGKDYTIVINGNPRAAQAINGDLNIEGTSQDYSALFGPVLRWMSSVNTSYNPEFWITNMMRDMAFTMMAVNIKEDPAYRRKFSKNYRKAFKVISLVAKNEKGTIGDSYLEQQYKDFVKYGGVTGYTQIKDSETWEQEIENYLSSNDPESIKSGKVMRGMKTAFHAAHRFGESLEQVSRFAAFLTARETGKSINEAINDAKEITVNFNRKGSGKMITLEEAKYLTGKNGQPLTKFQQWMAVGASSIAPLGRRFIMFFNAAIQGLNATYKLMKKNPKRFTGWALGYAAVGMMNAVLHAMLDDDDDYLDIPQYERRNSLMIGGNGAYFKWALPQEARAFYALGDLAVETVMGRNPHQNFLGEALKIGTEILPVNPSEGWKAFMPSVAIPFIELALNEDYKGAPIYNEQKWLSEEEKERAAKWSNAYQGTGWTYVKIAQGLNFITGGDKHDAGWINLQPEKLEHLVQSAFGGTIRTADKFINTISAAIDPEEPVTIRQTPFLNRFLTINDERFKNVHVNDVFDYYKADAEHALTLEKQYIKDRDMDSLIELRSSDEYQWAKIYGKYKKPLKAIQNKIKVADGTAEKKELMKQQDELKKRMIKEISEL